MLSSWSCRSTEEKGSEFLGSGAGVWSLGPLNQLHSSVGSKKSRESRAWVFPNMKAP